MIRPRERAPRLAASLWLGILLASDPLLAQVDLSGTWTLQNQQDYRESHAGNFPADFTGIPINTDARAIGMGWSGDILEELQRQCEPWPEHYLLQYGGPTTIRNRAAYPSGLRIAALNDSLTGRVTAWHISNSIDRMAVDVWIDGRAAPPPQELHTFGGSAKGEWRGDTLMATLTHLKDGFLTRNGIPSSNQETVTLFITRHGDDMLSITGIVRDPVYLSDSYPLAQSYRLDTTMSTDVPPTTCDPAETIPELSDGYHSVRVLPGASTILHYMQEQYNIPSDASQGGPQTMYPEFQNKLRGEYRVPSKYCHQYCCGAMGTRNETPQQTQQYDHTVLMCLHD